MQFPVHCLVRVVPQEHGCRDQRQGRLADRRPITGLYALQAGVECIEGEIDLLALAEPEGGAGEILGGGHRLLLRLGTHSQVMGQHGVEIADGVLVLKDQFRRQPACFLDEFAG